MPDKCCEDAVFEGMSVGYRRALVIVILINAMMFVVEMMAGYASQSMALRADALDFFGDTVTYSITLYVIGKSAQMRAGAALLKGVSLFLMGAWILVSTFYSVMARDLPQAEVMGVIGFLAFFANVLSAFLLYKYRNGDANVRSVWLCSRNDAVGNIAVIMAAGGVLATNTPWPDIAVAVVMASLFMTSSVQIMFQAKQEMKN
jgi:Co/Zn/Cd efflux system component